MNKSLALVSLPFACALALSACTAQPVSNATTSAATSSAVATSAASASAAHDDTTNPACTGAVTASPALTEGPYYVAGDFMRSDITEGQAGMPMTFTIRVVDTNCNPIPNATVDIWHANALGQYSGVSDPKEGCADCVDKTYLRGSQVTDANGDVTFTTIFPGWYSGRTVHIHVKVWQDGQDVLTTQFFVDKATADAVYATADYKGTQDVTNEGDRIAQGVGSGLADLMWSNTITDGVDTAFAQLVVG